MGSAGVKSGDPPAVAPRPPLRPPPPSAASVAPPHPFSPSAPPPAHQTDADEDDENVKQLGDCSALYLALQECLVRTDRDWKSCQPEVQALKLCHARKSKSKAS